MFVLVVIKIAAVIIIVIKIVATSSIDAGSFKSSATNPIGSHPLLDDGTVNNCSMYAYAPALDVAA
jgi:hypothetical protein